MKKILYIMGLVGIGIFLIKIASAEYHANNTYLDVYFHERYSDTWNFRYAPNETGDACYMEHYAIYSSEWGTVTSEEFTIDTYFEDSPDGRTAILHYENLQITRQIYVPAGDKKYFEIRYVLKNNGNKEINDLKFFEVVDYDIVDSSNDYGWYTESTDSIWQNDDNYFKNGFKGDKPSSNHGIDYWSVELYDDWNDGELNGLDKYPENGTSDVAVGMQWNIGNLGVGESWNITITFYFGEAAGIYADAGNNQVVKVGESVILNASSSTSVGTIISYEWDFNNDGIYDVSTDSPIYLYEGWNQPGEYIVWLRVTDDKGRIDTDFVIIKVVANVDLIVSNITIPSASDGDLATINATIENIGNESIPDIFYVCFKIDGIPVGYKTIYGLDAKKSEEIYEEWEVTAGVHVVEVVVDYYNDIIEENEENNNLSEILEIPYPDLTIINISYPKNMRSGKVAIINATIKNVGANTSNIFYIGFKIDDEYADIVGIDGLSSGNTYTAGIEWVATPGIHDINVTVDIYDCVVENNENNNSMSKVLPAIPPPPFVNLTYPNGGEILYGICNITWNASGLNVSIKIDLYDGYSYLTIAENLSNTGFYLFNTTLFPDGTYYKIKITACDGNGSISYDFSDNWFTIWNHPDVKISGYLSKRTVENVSTTYTIVITNEQPFPDTFNLSIDGDIEMAVLNVSKISLQPWESKSVMLIVKDKRLGVHELTLRVESDEIVKEEKIVVYVEEAFNVSIEAEKRETSIGGNITYYISIKNNQNIADNFSISLEGLDINWSGYYNLLSGEKKIIPLKLQAKQEGNFSFTIKVCSSNLGIEKHVQSFLNVSANPIIYDLKPSNNTITGSNKIVFTWITSTNSSTLLFIKKEGDENFSIIEGEAGIYHSIIVENLSRNNWYEFYVVSANAYGSGQSEIRRIFIDNGISFSQKNYEFYIERDYNQECFITIINTDDEAHEVWLNISNSPNDLILDFVGEGKDENLLLLPNESKKVKLVIHAQDAQNEEYNILLTLKNLEENITDSANLLIHVHIPNINFTIEEISFDNITLTRKYRIENYGDALTDLMVEASDELSPFVIFKPSINHFYLGEYESIEFEVSPILSENYSGSSGYIIVTAGGVEKRIFANFSVPDGKKVYVGQVPNVEIIFDAEFDNDGLLNTNPNGTVTSYLIGYENATTIMYIAQIMVKVLQDGAPAYNSEVMLEVKGNGMPKNYTGYTDIWGKCIFTIVGPVGNYRYRAKVVGYPAHTPWRNFSVSTQPNLSIYPKSILWLSAQDAYRVYNISNNVSEIYLDGSPYIIKGRIDRYLFNATPVLFLFKEAGYMEGEVIGKVEGKTIVFEIGEEIDPGKYRCIMALQAPGFIATSEEKYFIFGDNETSSLENMNFSYLMPYPINESKVGIIEMKNELNGKGKIIRLVWFERENNSFIFTYMLVSNKTANDTIWIEVRNESSIIYNYTRNVSFSEYKPIFIDVKVPIMNEFKIEIKANDPSRFISWIKSWTTDPGGIFDKETWKIFWKDGILTPHNRIGVIFKCVGSFLPGLGDVITAVDTVNKLTTGDWIGGMGGVGQLAIDPLKKIGLQKYEMTASYIWKLMTKNPEMADEIAKITKPAMRKIGAEARRIKNLAKIGKWIGWLGNIYSNYDDWVRVTREMEEKKARTEVHFHMNDWYCTNRPIIDVKFKMPSYIPQYVTASPPSPNIERAVLIMKFSLPWDKSAYRKHDVHILLNGVEIGNITNAIPNGYYIFPFNASLLKFAENGVAENVVTLNTKHLNGGHYVVSSDFQIILEVRKVAFSVIANNESEANETVGKISETVTPLADYAVNKISVPTAYDGQRVRIEIEVSQLSGMEIAGIPIYVFDNGEEIENWAIPYIPPYGSVKVATWWNATMGEHNITVRINPKQEIEERDYSNNQKSIILEVMPKDVTPPIISNVTPLGKIRKKEVISACIYDESGVNFSSLKIFVDGIDVTSNTTIGVNRIWYMPEELEEGMHVVKIYVEDNAGNNNSFEWNFSIEGNILYVGNGYYSSIQSAINDAEDGYTILIYNGTYYENLEVNKSINLVGEGNVVINGKGGIVINIISNNVSIKNVTIRNGSVGIKCGGNHIRIWGCQICSNSYGIFGENASIDIKFCNILNNSLYGVFSNKLINATYNYWGSWEGPEGASSDNVSNNVIYNPWLTAPVKGAMEKIISSGRNRIKGLDIALEINSTGNSSIRVISYKKSPVKTPIKSIGKYFEISIENESSIEFPILLKIYYTQEDLNDIGIKEEQIVGIYYYENNRWNLYNNSGVNTTDVNGYAGYAYALIWHLTNITVGIDVDKPIIQNIVATPENQNEINITCQVIDNIGIENVYINITYPDSSKHNFSMNKIGDTYYWYDKYEVAGEYNYYIWARDKNGNANTSAIKSFEIFIPHYSLEIIISPENAGFVTPSEGEYEEGSVVTLTAYANPGYEFAYWSGDASGNSATIQITMDSNKSIIANFVAVENHPPVKPSLIYPADGAVDVALNITLKWECSDPDGDSLKYDVYFGESLPLQKIASNISKDEYVPSLDYGKTYYWRIVAWDEHGAKNESNVWHFSTIQKPNITILEPENESTVKGKIVIKGKAWNAIRVEIKIDDGEWIIAKGTNNWSYEINTKELSNGEHKIYARAYDGKGYSDIAVLSINVFNNHIPLVSILKPFNGSIVKGEVVIQGNATDEDNNIIRVEIRIDDGDWEAVNGINEWQYVLNTKKLKNGWHVIEVRAYDGYNYSNITAISIKVKNEKGIPGFEILLIIIAIFMVISKRKLWHRQ